MKRFLCILCSLAILFGIIFAAIPASAAEVGTVSSASANSIIFDPNDQWHNFSHIYCHIFVYNGDPLADWQTKKERCTDNGDGTWTYDLDAKGLALSDGVSYCVMFSADTGVETYQCLMDTSCYGDTVYIDGTKTENPVDSSKTSYTAYWTNADKNKYGPVLAVTSIGNVVGSALSPTDTSYRMYIDFLTDKLDNARFYSGKTDQQLLDDTAKALGLNAGDVEKAIYEAGVEANWRMSQSSLSGGGGDQPISENDAFYFDVASTGWRNYNKIYCYIYVYNEYNLAEWGSKKTLCTDEGSGIWSYSPLEKGIGYDVNKAYCLIFSSDTGASTCSLVADSSCFGDTAYATGEMTENSSDSNKVSTVVRWKNADPEKYGPLLEVTSIGNVIGSVPAVGVTRYDLFVNFLQNSLYLARMYSGKSDQQLIDDVASALKLGKNDVEKAIREAGESFHWSKESSSLPAVGESSDSDFDRFCRALVHDYSDWMQKNPGKSDQQLIDMIAAEYGMYQDDVEKALSLIGAGDVGWSKQNSGLPAGSSGYQYTVGAYYLAVNYQNGKSYVDENNLMRYDKNSGYYVIYGVELDKEDTVEVVRFNEDRTFSLESESALKSPRYNGYLFFFRPQSEGYNFGFNTAEEYYSQNGYGSSGYLSSITVSITSTEDAVDGVKISWDEYPGAKTYEVFVRETGGWKSVGQTEGLSFVDKTAKSGDVITYSVRAKDERGEYCSSFHTDPKLHRYIGAPKITGFDSTPDGVVIYFNGVSGNARYRVYVRDGILWKAIGDTYGTSFLHRAKEKPVPVTPYDPSEVTYTEGGASSISTGSSTSSTGSSTGWGGYSYSPEFYDIPAEEGKVYNYRVRCVSYDGYTELGAYITDAVGTQYNPLAPQVILGDVDGDGTVSVIDATKIQKLRASILTEKDINISAADVDRDGVVSVLDATRIQKYKASIMNLDGTKPFRE